MENKYLLAKNYNIQQEYVLNSYIDAKDTVNHWCVGQVVDVIEANNQVRVHFEGWSSRYDEVRRSRPKCFHKWLICCVDDQKELSEDRPLQKAYGGIHWLEEEHPQGL